MKKSFFAAAIICAALTACSSDDNTVTPPALSDAQSRAAAEMQSFDTRFFEAASADAPGKNMLVSPLSMSMLLSMVANGADVSTTDQICNAFGCNDLEALNELAQKYNSWLPKADKKVKVSSANSVWYNDRLVINPSLSETMGKSYSADVFARNFNNASSLVTEANKWVSKKTDGMIAKYFDRFPTDSPIVLINALYFKGLWTNPFNKRATMTREFHGLHYISVVNMMENRSEIQYLANDKCEVVRKDFGAGQFYADLILPAEGLNIDEFVESGVLTNMDWSDFDKMELTLGLPRFTIKPTAQSTNYTDILANMGISNLTKKQKTQFFTDDVEAWFNISQNATIEFNEEGAKAAAVSSSGELTSPGPLSGSVFFNRPFVFFIREAMTNRILFAGKVSDL